MAYKLPILQWKWTAVRKIICLGAGTANRECHSVSCIFGVALSATNDNTRTLVCNDVAIEPSLQSLSGEVITPQSANQQDDARADIHARGFWGRQQSAF